MTHEEVFKRLIEKAAEANIEVGSTEKSITDFGESWYVPFEGLANFRIRISDHTVGEWRVNEPQLYIESIKIDNMIDNIIDRYFKSCAGINMKCFHASTSEAKQRYFKLKYKSNKEQDNV